MASGAIENQDQHIDVTLSKTILERCKFLQKLDQYYARKKEMG